MGGAPGAGTLNPGSRTVPLAAGAASGALAAGALPPWSLWFLAPMALVPVAVAVLRARDPVVAVRAGLVFGVVHWALVLHWLPGTLGGVRPALLLPGALLLLTLVGVSALQLLALHALAVERRWSPLLVLPAVWGGGEFLLANAGPIAFPWAPLGLALAAVPEIAGVAELLGVGGLTLWLAGVNGGVAGLVAAPEGSRGGRIRLGVIVLLFAVIPAVWSLHRASTLPLRALPPVALVQLDLSRAQLGDPEERDRAAEEALDRILGEGGKLAAAGVAMIVLPEAPFATSWEAGVERWTEARAEELGVPILIGAHREGGDGQRQRPRNAALLVVPGEGVRFEHAKRRLVPGAEWPALAPGEELTVGELPGLAFGVLICFESAFAGEAAGLRRRGAELLVNPTIDAWPGAGRGGTGSAAHAQHRAHLALRAIETRAGVVRAAIGGEVLVVDPVGRVRVVSPVGGDGVWRAIPTTSDEIPFRARFGDLGGLIGLLLGAGLFVRRVRDAGGRTRHG